MLSALNSYPAKVGYEVARGALLGFQYMNPEKSPLFFKLQRISTLFEAAYLVSDYRDFYDNIKEEKGKPWYQGRNFLLCLTVCISAWASFRGVSAINRMFKPTLNLSSTASTFKLEWDVPLIHRISQAIILNRAFVNLLPALVQRDVKKGFLAASQLVSLGRLSFFKWVRVDRPVYAISGDASFFFHVHSMEKLQQELPAICGYVKSCFQATFWHMERGGNHSYFTMIQAPEFASSFLDRAWGWGKIGDKSAPLSVNISR